MILSDGCKRWIGIVKANKQIKLILVLTTGAGGEWMRLVYASSFLKNLQYWSVSGCVHVYRSEVDTGHLSIAFHLIFLHRGLEFADWLVWRQAKPGFYQSLTQSWGYSRVWCHMGTNNPNSGPCGCMTNIFLLSSPHCVVLLFPLN